MASTTQDDGFHEIQLNGKQLVFLFMAATVVSVVIFLCGVLVGRGVRADRGPAVDLTTFSEAPLPLSPAPVAPPSAPAAAGSDPRTASAPPPVADDNSYFSRLEGKNPSPASEELKTATAPRSDVAPPASSAPAAATAPAAAPSAQSPAASGYTVQVAAVNVRKEAEQIVKRLEGKGYPAYVVDPAKGTPAMFRVRIGAFKTRGEADTLAAKLKSQEHFQPWVTR